MADEKWVDQARARLSRPKVRKGRAGTAAALVQALLPEIAEARAAGKTWEEIAADISQERPLNADAVRIAFMRATRGRGGQLQPVTVARPVKVRKPSSPAVSAPEAVGTDPFGDLFNPMFDARDTRGRGVAVDASVEG